MTDPVPVLSANQRAADRLVISMAHRPTYMHFAILRDTVSYIWFAEPSVCRLLTCEWPPSLKERRMWDWQLELTGPGTLSALRG